MSTTEVKIAEAYLGGFDHQSEQTLEVFLRVSSSPPSTPADIAANKPFEFKRVEIRARGGNRDNHGIQVTLQSMERHTVRWLIEALTKVEPFLTDGDKPHKLDGGRGGYEQNFKQFAVTNVPTPVLSYDRNSKR